MNVREGERRERKRRMERENIERGENRYKESKREREVRKRCCD